MRLQSATDLQSHLDQDFAWRIREIDYAKDQARLAVSKRQQTVVRASVPLLYAHWEGFIKNAAEALLNFVAHQKHSYNQLKPCFVAHGLKAQLGILTHSHKHSKRTEAVEFILDHLSTRASFPWKNAISTRSNLSSHVFKEIAAALGISTASYETRNHFIDVSLLERRNRIAHGEWLELDVDGLRDLADELINLLRRFKTDVENLVATKGYLRD